MPALDHFGWIAPFYDRLASPPDAAFWRAVLRLPTSGRLLDIGGGTGRISSVVAEDARQVVIADASWKMARQAVEKPALLALAAEGEGLPFASRTFDRVLMVDALHHVRHQPQCVAEMLRVLAPGGRIVIVEPDLRLRSIKVLAVIEKLLLMRSQMRLPEAICALFSGHPVTLSVRSSGSSVVITADA